MYILLTAATPFEIKPAVAYLEGQGFRTAGHEFSILITGIGSMMTAYSLTKAIYQRRPDYLLQAGIAGSFKPNLLPPEVVIVKEEVTGDLGAREERSFTDIFDLGLLDTSAFPFNNKRLVNPFTDYNLPAASGITINEISTDKERIELIKEKYHPDIESMEGAAFHYVALSERIPFLQLRAISNMVGERNKQNWRMKEAIQALNESLIKLLPQLKLI